MFPELCLRAREVDAGFAPGRWLDTAFDGLRIFGLHSGCDTALGQARTGPICIVQALEIDARAPGVYRRIGAVPDVILAALRLVALSRRRWDQRTWCRPVRWS
jgi:hypothetical protein